MVVIRIIDWYKARGPQLDGSGKELTDVPIQEIRNFQYIASVRVLDLSSNRIKAIPNDFAPLLYQIESLDLSNNCLQFLPDNIYLMTELHTFRCTHNQIQRLPSTFSDLQTLTYLDMSHNPLAQTFALTQENEKWTKEDCMVAAVEVRRLVIRLNTIRTSTDKFLFDNYLEDSDSSEMTEEDEETPHRSDSLPTAREPVVQGRPKTGEDLELWFTSETDLAKIAEVQIPILDENQNEVSLAPVVEPISETDHSIEDQSLPSSISAVPVTAQPRPVTILDFPPGYEYLARYSNPSITLESRVTDSDCSRWIRASPTEVHIRRSESQVRLVELQEPLLNFGEERLMQQEPVVVLRSMVISLTKWTLVFWELVFLSSFVLVFTVDQRITDAFINEYSEFMPSFLPKSFNYIMNFVQEYTNRIHMDLPLIKYNKEQEFWTAEMILIVSAIITASSLIAQLFIG